MRLSIAMTRNPSASKRSLRWEPRNPAPPVTTAVFFESIDSNIRKACSLSTLFFLSRTKGVANVLGLFPPERVFANICGVISDAFKSTRDENYIEVNWNLVRVSPHPFRQFVVEAGIESIKI